MSKRPALSRVVVTVQLKSGTLYRPKKGGFSTLGSIHCGRSCKGSFSGSDASGRITSALHY
eukprot:4861931-Amphidinium_carterae.1